MFQDIAHFQTLFHSVWPAGDIIQVDAAGAFDTFSAGGNASVTANAAMTTGSWNYGVDFGGPTKSSWTSGANTDRAMHGVRGEGAFGNSFVGDSAYAATTGGTSTAGVTMCQGTTTGTHPTWCK